MKISLLFLLFCFVTSGCGWKLPPEALFPTSPSNIDNEIKIRKSSQNKQNEDENSKEKK